MSEKFRKDLTQGSVTKQLLKFSVPFLLSNLLQALYSVADMVIVGQFCGKSGITGVSIGGQINILVTGAALGLAIGGTVLIAQYGGAKKYDDQKSTIGTMTTLYIILSAVLTVVMALLTKPILRLLKTPDNAFEEAVRYLTICMLGTVFMFLYNAISAILRGMGDSKRPLYFVAIAAAVNVVGDIVLVGPLKMGAAGAAVATISSQGISVILSLIYLFSSGFFSGYKIKDFRIITSTRRIFVHSLMYCHISPRTIIIHLWLLVPFLSLTPHCHLHLTPPSEIYQQNFVLDLPTVRYIALCS